MFLVLEYKDFEWNVGFEVYFKCNKYILIKKIIKCFYCLLNENGEWICMLFVLRSGKMIE